MGRGHEEVVLWDCGHRVGGGRGRVRRAGDGTGPDSALDRGRAPGRTSQGGGRRTVHRHGVRRGRAGHSGTAAVGASALGDPRVRDGRSRVRRQLHGDGARRGADRRRAGRAAGTHGAPDLSDARAAVGARGVPEPGRAEPRGERPADRRARCPAPGLRHGRRGELLRARCVRGLLPGRRAGPHRGDGSAVQDSGQR